MTAPVRASERADGVHCFACAAPGGPGTKVVRFSLRDARQRRNCGGIFLCERCWKQTRLIAPRRGPLPRALRAAA